MIDIIQTWKPEMQIGFFLTSLILILLALLILAFCALKTIRILFRGYPSRTAQVCKGEGTLSGLCLNSNGCKTPEECKRWIKIHNEEYSP